MNIKRIFEKRFEDYEILNKLIMHENLILVYEKKNNN